MINNIPEELRAKIKGKEKELEKAILDLRDVAKKDLGLPYHKSDHVYMSEHDLKEMTFYCADDNCFVANFVGNDGNTFDFKMSRAKVMEHVEKTCAHPEKYLTNKGLVVAHFHAMAKAWYAMAYPKC